MSARNMGRDGEHGQAKDKAPLPSSVDRGAVRAVVLYWRPHRTAQEAFFWRGRGMGSVPPSIAAQRSQ